jgi:acyl-CoA oxidase
MTSTAEHLRNALDGRWRDVKNQARASFEHEQFRPHYTPNTVIARAKVFEQMKIIATARVPDEGFRKEHGGTGDVGAAITMIQMLGRDVGSVPGDFSGGWKPPASSHAA